MRSPMQGGRLQRRSTVDAAVEALRDQILEGEVEPGSALREAELCEIFEVSRATIRSALLTLSHEGLVRLVPNRGAIVSDLGPEDVGDIYGLRLVLEQEAARRLAGQGAALDPVREAMDALRELPEDSPWGVVRDADLDFHRALVGTGLQSRRAVRVMDSLLNELRLCFRQIRYEFEHHSSIVDQHQILLDALEGGNADAAVALIRERIERSRRDIVKQLEIRNSAGE